MKRIWLVSVLLVMGCAQTPLGRSVDQTLRVEVPGCPPVRCELSNNLGQWVVESTPGTVTVKTSAQPLQASCTLNASAPGITRLPPSQAPPSKDAPMKGAVIGGGVGAVVAAPAFAFGGPFGILAATLVAIGAASGAGLAQTADAAGRAFSYPEVVTVTMVCPGPIPDALTVAAGHWGMSVRAATAAEGAPAGSVRVTGLAPDGRAAAAGLRVGDLVLSVNGQPVGGTLELEDALAAAAAARSPLTLIVRREGVDTQLVLQAGSAR